MLYKSLPRKTAFIDDKDILTHLVVLSTRNEKDLKMKKWEIYMTNQNIIVSGLSGRPAFILETEGHRGVYHIAREMVIKDGQAKWNCEQVQLQEGMNLREIPNRGIEIAVGTFEKNQFNHQDLWPAIIEKGKDYAYQTGCDYFSLTKNEDSFLFRSIEHGAENKKLITILPRLFRKIVDN